MSAVVRVEQALDPVARIADERAQQLVLGEPHVLQRVGGEEPVLDDEERRVGLLGDATGDGRQVGRLLRVPGEEDAPARVGDTHDIVVAGVDVERLAGQGPGPDVEDDRAAACRSGRRGLPS